MAVTGTPKVNSGNSAIKVALIVFVALTVLSLGGTIFMYTQQEDLKAKTKIDATRADDASRKEREARDQLARFIKAVTGKEINEGPAIEQAMKDLKAGLKEVAGDEMLKSAGVGEETALLAAMKTVYTQFDAARRSLEESNAAKDALQAELAQKNEDFKKIGSDFDGNIQKLRDDYDKLQKSSDTMHRQWQDDTASFETKRQIQLEEGEQQLGRERERRQAAEQETEKSQKRIKELVNTLASFRPKSDQLDVMKIADGQIVRTVIGENIVYISLGTKEGIKRGMTFAVYSRDQKIPDGGQGKAGIEVVEPFEEVSECKVIRSSRHDPVKEGDLIGNPVFDRSRKYNFLVAGDFDLDLDGVAEDRGGEQVAHLISGAGGNVVKKLDTQTDFVVLGIAPPLSGEQAKLDNPVDQERASRRQIARKAFDDMVQEAKAMSIPMLSGNQLMRFLGIVGPTHK